MSLSAPQRAALLALRDLRATRTGGHDGPELRIPIDTAAVQTAAERYRGRTRVTEKTLDGLVRKCIVFRRAGEWDLTEAGRQRLREGVR